MFDLIALAAVILVAAVFLGYKWPGIAFVAAPVIMFFLGYVGVVTQIEGFLLFAAVVFIVMLIAIAASGFERDSRQWFHWGAWWLLTGIAVSLLLGSLLVGLVIVEAGFLLPVVFVLGMMALIASLLYYGGTSVRIVEMNVFTTLGAIIRQNLPLPMALDCAAAGFDYSTASILRRIKTWLVKGYPLTEAVRHGYPQCSSRALAMLAAGEQINQLPAAVRAIEDDVKQNALERRRLRPVPAVYPLIVLIFAFVVLMGLMGFVIPQFKTVLEETLGESSLPWATQVLMHVMSFFVYDTHPGLVLALLVLLIVEYQVHQTSHRRRLERPYPLLWLGDFLKWRLPVVHWFEKRRSLIQVADVLRMALNAGRPVNEAIRSALDLDINQRFRRRLACWLTRVERGEDIPGSARRCRLGASLAWAFDRGADTPAVLELLESHYRATYIYRVNLARYIIWPLVIIMLGSTVGFIVYGMFSPAVAVLRELANSVYP